MSKSHVQEGWIESGVKYSVQEVVSSAGWTNLCVCPFNRIYPHYAWQRAADVTKQVNTMRANIVGFKQEEITQLALDSEIPALRIRRCKFTLEPVIAGQRKDDGQKFVAIECEWTRLLCWNTWNVSTFIEDASREAIRSEEIKEESKISLERRVRTGVAEEIGKHAVVEDAVPTADGHLRWATG